MGVPKGRHLCHIDDGMYGAARHVACRPFRFFGAVCYNPHWLRQKMGIE